MKVLQEIKVPQESVNDQYLTVMDVFFKNGDFVKANDILIELETSKTTLTLESKTDGYVYYLCEKKQEVAVNSVIIKICDKIIDNEVVILDQKENLPDTKNKVPVFLNLIPVFSKEALNLIAQYSLPKESFNGFDLVNHEDILAFLNKSKAQDNTKNEYSRTIEDNLPFSENEMTIEPLSKSKKREIEYLSQVQSASMNSVINVWIDTNGLFTALNHSLRIIKNSLLPIITYEVSKLLIKYPIFNAFYFKDNIAIYKNINIGIAMDMGNGLKTVKIPSTDTLSIHEIEQSILNLSEKYIDKTLNIKELTGITFTITDLSAEGVSFFTPLINKNNAAILAISSVDTLLNRVILSLAFDHRVTEGKLATIFLSELKERIESYSTERTGKNIQQYTCYKCLKKLNNDFSGIGFVKVIDPMGNEKLICQTCFKGF
jgi:pyruvate/2-oxoglutarate dehydrogenase complex dihydrolipoamide acyltransferase (E2) component